jgi:type I restriction enzyme, R subunit
MANFISEDDIERDIIKVFRNETLAYEYLNCYTATAENLNDGSGRSDKKQVVLQDRLYAALRRFNSKLPEAAIEAAVKQLTMPRNHLSAFEANKAVYQLIRDGVQVEVTNNAGRKEPKLVRVIAFDQQGDNNFLDTG